MLLFWKKKLFAYVILFVLLKYINLTGKKMRQKVLLGLQAAPKWSKWAPFQLKGHQCDFHPQYLSIQIHV